MHTHGNSRSLEFLYQSTFLFSILGSINKLYFTRFVNVHLCVLVNISICVTCKSDRFLPVAYAWLDSLYYDRSTEYSSVQDRTDRSVRALVHFLEVVFFHTCVVWSDGRTFNCNTIFLGCFCCIDGYLVIGIIAVCKTKVIVFCIQINIRK